MVITGDSSTRVHESPADKLSNRLSLMASANIATDQGLPNPSGSICVPLSLDSPAELATSRHAP